MSNLGVSNYLFLNKAILSYLGLVYPLLHFLHQTQQPKPPQPSSYS